MHEKILLADDSPAIRYLVSEVLTEAGFTVITAQDGQEAIEKTYQESPDLLILDYEMPRKTGFDVVKEVRSHTGYLHTPIIICTAVTDKSTKLEGLNLDIDDYLTKPTDGDEMVARVKLLLKRNQQQMASNPLTHLPGNPSIQERLKQDLDSQKTFAVLYCDLNNFKSYNDQYGFDAGDHVLKTVADLIVQETAAIENSFVGHIGGDDFLVVCPFEQAENLAQTICRKIDKTASSFYNETDRKNGFMWGHNRKGKPEKFGFLSIAIGVVHNAQKPLTSVAQISEIGTLLKTLAKQQEGSTYRLDNR